MPREPKGFDAPCPAGHVTIQEAAKIAELSASTITRWVRRGLLPARRLAGQRQRWIRETDLQEAIRKWKEISRGRDPTSVSPNEAAKVLNVTGEAVKQWIYAGDLKATKLPNGYWRIKHEDLKAYLETRQNVVPMVYVATCCDPILAERILGVAGKLGHKAGSVMSTSDALKQFDQSAPKLLLVDLGNFPDGWKLIRKVRGTSYYGSPKILLVGKEPLGEKETGDALRLGINGCLVGEVTDTVLEAEVKGLLGKER